MRIAYVFDPLLPHRDADAEQAINTVCSLTRAGAEVELVLPRHNLRPGASARELAEYYKVQTPLRVTHLRSLFPSHRALEKLGHAVRAASHLWQRGFDVVYSRNASAAFGALALGHRVVYETYRPWPEQRPVLAPAFRLAMGRDNFVGAVLHSAYVKRKYRDIGIADGLLEVAHNGFEPALFEPRPSRAEARAQVGLPADARVVLYAGRVTAGKGVGLLLDLAERNPDVVFAIVGSQQRGELERRAETLPNARVFPWASFDELPAYLLAADLLIIPPSLVGLTQVGDTVLPMKLFLYLAAGRPILAPRAPDTAELLVHDDNAWLVEPDDLDAASRGIEAILGSDELAGRLGRAAERLSRDYTWDARAARILAFVRRRLAEIDAGQPAV